MPETTTAVANSPTSSFATALAQALRQLDRDGRLTAENARRLRRVIAETPKEPRLYVAMEPERYFGPFESLPREARDAIVRAIRDDDRWRMAGRNMGGWHVAMTQLVRTASTKLRKSKLGRPTHELTEVFFKSVRDGPAYGVHEVYRRRLLWQGKFMARPTLAAMLRVAQIEPWHFAVCYARGLPQPAPFRGFWHDPSRQNTIGVMLGIDLLRTPEGWWLIESNLNSALRRGRTAIYDRDPFVSNLLDFVRGQGYRHLIVMMNNAGHVDPLMAKQYEEGAAAHEIKLTILEDAFLQKRAYSLSYGVPPLDEDGTLVMRIKYYPTSLDHLFQHKRASRQALEVYKRHSSDPALRLLPTGLEPILERIDLNDPFPNLVYKLPERDSGGGVRLLKVTSPEHAHTVLQELPQLKPPESLIARFRGRMHRQMFDHNGIFQPFVRSSMLPGRRLYIVRAHVLITPIGNHFLSAHRVVSGSAVPESLPLGLVQDPTPYLVNYSEGAKYEVVPQEEESEVVTAALAVARGLAWAAAYGFQTTAE
jgi:hypothetical protein